MTRLDQKTFTVWTKKYFMKMYTNKGICCGDFRKLNLFWNCSYVKCVSKNSKPIEFNVSWLKFRRVPDPSESYLRFELFSLTSVEIRLERLHKIELLTLYYLVSCHLFSKIWLSVTFVTLWFPTYLPTAKFKKVGILKVTRDS